MFVVGLACQQSHAQTQVQGRITDGRSRDPLPFASILFKGTTIGVTADFEGNFRLSSPQGHDSIVVSYIGYKKRTIAIQPNQTQTLHIQLQEDAENMREVVIRPGRRREENPAHPIMRKVLEAKSRHNKTSLLAYEYEAYTKAELNLQRLPDDTQKKKLVRQVKAAYDSIYTYTSEEGEALMPVFLSESISRYYFRTRPELRREHILHTSLKGFGVEDGSLLSQLVGSSFQEYNFYENWLNILEKEFASPLADGWKLYYDYELQDSLLVEGRMCYKIGVSPKREQDLAFWGTLWITKKEYALQQLDLQVLPKANLNFVHKIAISQQLQPTAASGWLPAKTRVLIDMRRPGKEGGGVVAKFYTSYKDPLVNQPRQPDFYANPLTVEARAPQASREFWSSNRHDSLSLEEEKIGQMIDSANQLPAVKRNIRLVKALATGYVKAGTRLEIGPYPLFYTFNDLEGHRLGAGLRTTTAFSAKYRLSAFAAYGTKDNRLKYNAQAERLLSRNSWTLLRLYHSSDVEQIGLDADELSSNSIFYASSRWGSLRLPYHYQRSGLGLQTDLSRGITAGISFDHRNFEPVFAFGYRTGDEPAVLATSFRTSEVRLNTRFSWGEAYLINDFERLSAGTQGWPVLSFGYAYGIPGLLGADFEYHRLALHATQRVKMAFLGVSRYTVEAGKYFGALPYPLLKVHLGNETAFYTSAAYGLMNVGEFASDSWASLRYIHYFEGFLLNRVPLIKKLKWRAIAHGSLLWGQLSKENQQLVAPLDPGAEGVLPPPRSLSDIPYVELGYGIENIFRVFRVDAFHRLTYLELPNARRFGLKVSMTLVL
ncbi:TonB-linked outer membrane protein, SusC/RagA family [Cesiribacter andamanensis AMV16]|uniref:TonB-linked outer membrane protein, SusC/RagA family n=1 Tax=Cesiribacter andamanensis AMV16 TaxID=1279009 RepID=M7NRP3_9BACT|nr:TonB-linked outer membrane protein, SusC/RagA family [Cesiribacter andamanensis AMV16]